MPSDKEMEARGMDVTEINKLLVKKVEELTLYLIELKKENETIRRNQSTIRAQVKKLGLKRKS